MLNLFICYFTQNLNLKLLIISKISLAEGLYATSMLVHFSINLSISCIPVGMFSEQNEKFGLRITL